MNVSEKNKLKFQCIYCDGYGYITVLINNIAYDGKLPSMETWRAIQRRNFKSPGKQLAELKKFTKLTKSERLPN